ncbi:gastric triacylglycerol lipase-like [Folsomia candida]|uniref:gastric triacylglycerol lipase-like n=1 Tax=Folsomia candida TaxID=158441 RepID=UPI001604DE59|nr:gastric triacylglycerol lipase-like [Folsomia candida]
MGHFTTSDSALIMLSVVVTFLCIKAVGSQLYSDFQSSKDPVTDIFSLAQVLKKSNENPAAQLTTPMLVQKYGYPVESHKVVTSDGYVLTMHRIPHGKNEYFHENEIHHQHRPVVILQHGLFASSFEWMMNKPDKLLALKLADSGWDVWLGNARGNAYSREHLTLSPSQKEFWEFSFHEMGDKDIPAVIDYILNTTGHKKLKYVGFSMGTTMFWTMMSLHPEYNEKGQRR